jgi:hypothetical protein
MSISEAKDCCPINPPPVTSETEVEALPVVEAVERLTKLLTPLNEEYATRHAVLERENARPWADRVMEVYAFQGQDEDMMRRAAEQSVRMNQETEEKALWSIWQECQFLSGVIERLRGLPPETDVKKVLKEWQALVAHELGTAYDRKEAAKDDSVVQGDWLAQKFRAEALADLLKKLGE